MRPVRKWRVANRLHSNKHWQWKERRITLSSTMDARRIPKGRAFSIPRMPEDSANVTTHVSRTVVLGMVFFLHARRQQAWQRRKYGGRPVPWQGLRGKGVINSRVPQGREIRIGGPGHHREEKASWGESLGFFSTEPFPFHGPLLREP